MSKLIDHFPGFFKKYILIFILTIIFFLPLSVTAVEHAAFRLFNVGVLEGPYKLPGTGIPLVDTLGIIIQVALSLLGIIFMGLIIYAGYNWMTAMGDEQKVTKAKDTITRAVIGLVIVIAAYAVSYFVIQKFGAPITK